MLSTNTIIRRAVIGSATGLLALLTLAPSASAAGGWVTPGVEKCETTFATSQIRATGTATGDGARFRLKYNGSTLNDTYGRVNAVAFERRSSFGNFWGPGYYSLCAKNTGTQNTYVTLDLATQF